MFLEHRHFPSKVEFRISEFLSARLVRTPDNDNTKKFAMAVTRPGDGAVANSWFFGMANSSFVNGATIHELIIGLESVRKNIQVRLLT